MSEQPEQPYGSRHPENSLYRSMTGGPHGLGDPNNRTLRKVEKDVAIPKEMKKRAVKICKKEVAEFNACGKNNGYLLPFKCKAENDKMNACITTLFKDPVFWDKAEKDYLDARSEYRRTGITKQDRDEAERQKKLQAAREWEKQKAQQSSVQ